eukprot:scaffold115797_cov57-Phaeocystis_antarctica.AAC.1
MPRHAQVLHHLGGDAHGLVQSHAAALVGGEAAGEPSRVGRVAAVLIDGLEAREAVPAEGFELFDEFGVPGELPEEIHGRREDVERFAVLGEGCPSGYHVLGVDLVDRGAETLHRRCCLSAVLATSPFRATYAGSSARAARHAATICAIGAVAAWSRCCGMNFSTALTTTMPRMEMSMPRPFSLLASANSPASKLDTAVAPPCLRFLLFSLAAASTARLQLATNAADAGRVGTPDGVRCTRAFHAVSARRDPAPLGPPLLLSADTKMLARVSAPGTCAAAAAPPRSRTTTSSGRGEVHRHVLEDLREDRVLERWRRCRGLAGRRSRRPPRGPRRGHTGLRLDHLVIHGRPAPPQLVRPEPHAPLARAAVIVLEVKVARGVHALGGLLRCTHAFPEEGRQLAHVLLEEGRQRTAGAGLQDPLRMTIGAGAGGPLRRHGGDGFQPRLWRAPRRVRDLVQVCRQVAVFFWLAHGRGRVLGPHRSRRGAAVRSACGPHVSRGCVHGQVVSEVRGGLHGRRRQADVLHPKTSDDFGRRDVSS